MSGKSILSHGTICGGRKLKTQRTIWEYDSEKLWDLNVKFSWGVPKKVILNFWEHSYDNWLSNWSKPKISNWIRKKNNKHRKIFSINPSNRALSNAIVCFDQSPNQLKTTLICSKAVFEILFKNRIFLFYGKWIWPRLRF